MSGTALATTLAVAVALVLGVVVVLLARQVRQLRAEVETLGRPSVVQPPEAPAEPLVEPAVPEPAVPEPAVAEHAVAEAVAVEEDLVLTPTPIGAPEVEPDLSVSRVASVTLAGPLIKVAAFSHGVRRALTEDSRMRVAYAFRKELRRQRKARRKRAAARPPGKEGWRP